VSQQASGACVHRFDSYSRSMASYTVTYPICGSVTVFVDDASSEEDAIEKGWDLTDDKESELYWEAMRYIVQGNVFNGSHNVIEVIED
jgi:hypothetical protein